MQGIDIVRVDKRLQEVNPYSDHTPSRHEKSLGLLTAKFVTLLQEAKDGVLDLKVVSTFVVCPPSIIRVHCVVKPSCCVRAFLIVNRFSSSLNAPKSQATIKANKVCFL